MFRPISQVFWPVDEKGEGYIIGRQSSEALVVICVLMFADDVEACTAVARWNSQFAVVRGQYPLQILGKCVAMPANAQIDIAWEDTLNVTEQIDLDSLLAIPEFSKIECRSKHNRPPSVTTKTSKRRLGINDTLIVELNTSWNTMESLRQLVHLAGFIGDTAESEATEIETALYLFDPSCAQEWLLYLRSLLVVPNTLLASSQQVDLRLEQLGFILHQLKELKHFDGPSNNRTSARYICAQNCLWLILNDIIIGIAVGMFLVDNRIQLARATIQMAELVLVSAMKETLHWLNNWPAGLKLNTELSQFFFQTCNTVMSLWEVTIHTIAQALPTIFLLQGLSGVLGMSMILALFSDLVSLFTLHIAVSYAIIRTAFKYQLFMANSLFNLFRGKRYNALRKRTDDWNYDLDQLLLGAMLFTLISFLFPTITTYYSLFALARLLITLLHAGFEVALAMLNHFPLFALTLRLKDPKRLPGGVVFLPAYRQRYPGFALTMQNSPLAYSRIFSQYFVLGARLITYYSPVRLLSLLVRGDSLDLVPRHWIRYTYKFHFHGEE